ncbi:MAG: MarR family transcriptional regulator [Proteobacteria bacterium]|nr:MarR family transcriptional regulator [Pseudomonadota bacterium]
MIADPGLSETVGCLCLASRRAARAITREFDRELRPHGLRATQFSLLAILELKGPQSIGDLAHVLGADRTTLTRNLALVEDQALVRSRPGDDARSRIIEITPKGRSRLTGAFAAWRKTQSALTASIGNEAVNSLRRLARSAPISSKAKEE